MKPNDNKAGNDFNASRMQDQLRYAGLVEVCRIRKLGYPVRRPFEEFFKRFRCCEPSASNFEELLTALKEQGHLDEGEWAIGHSKFFMRTAQSYKLELVREAAFVKVVVIVQKAARRYVGRRRYLGYLKLLQVVADALQQRNVALEAGEQVSHLAALSSAIEMAEELPYKGVHLDTIKAAKAMQARLKDEIRVTNLLESAIKEMDINSLKNAISAASNLIPPFEPPLFQKAVSAVERLEAELEIRETMRQALETKRSWMEHEALFANRETILSILTKAEEMEYECDETRQAKTLLDRLRVEEAQIMKLRESFSSLEAESSMVLQSVEPPDNFSIEASAGRRKDLNAIVKRLLEVSEETSDMGLECPEVISAGEMIERLRNEILHMVAAEEAEKKRLEKEAERKRLEEEAERKRLADEAERKRLEEEAERARLAAEEEKRKKAEEAERAAAAAAEEEAIRKAEHNAKLKLREENAARVSRSLEEAGEKRDLKMLNEAIQEAIQIGLNDHVIEKATETRAKLQLLEEAKSKLRASAKIPKLERGISDSDVNNLDAAIEFAKNAGFPEDWIAEELENARKDQERNHTYLKVQEDVKQAMASGDRSQLRAALDKAENLDMQDDVVMSAKQQFKVIE